LEKAIIMPPEKLGEMALLKVSGISIALGSLLEEQGKLNEAYVIFSDSLRQVREKGSSPEERMRAVALAQRCGDLASIEEVSQLLSDTVPTLADSSSLAEDHLRWSVEELLRLTVSDTDRSEALSNPESPLILADLDLPPWISGATLGASLEALGQLYASQGRSEYAIPLYVQAINLLMPANKASRTRDPTVSERCRTGILMNNIAHLLIDADKSSAKVDEATTWALKGLDIVGFALRGARWDGKKGKGFTNVVASDEARTNEVKGQCWNAEVALLSNLGEMARLKKDDCKARDMFQRTYMKADMYGMREYRSRAAQALSELERSINEKTKGK
jgi:tetratricopeptide (TPR) repeat protein